MTRAQVMPLGYTMEEAATRLRIGRRSLQELVKDHPFYYANGHRKLFTEDDIAALMQVMRQKAEPCRSSSSRPAQAKARIGASVGRTSESTWIRARELLSRPKRGN